MRSCAYCGRENNELATNCRECGTDLPELPRAPAPAREPAPEPPRSKILDPEILATAFTFADGFHRADWTAIAQWIETHVISLDFDDAWNEAARFWVAKLRSDLGGDYYTIDSCQTILLCDQPQETASWLLGYAGRVADTVREHLGVAWRGGFGKDVLLVFTEEDDYYQYVSYHCPDGEQATSGGMCIHSGYTHIAMPWRDMGDAANTVVHELTHDSLAHLPLPLWLNEGVAMTLQRLIAPPTQGLGRNDQDALYAATINWRPPIMWDELAERHFAFWNEENIQAFWAGTSFYEPGDSNELSYSLAEVLVKLLGERTSVATFRNFLQSASQSDAGQTAATDILGADLGEIAATFLGEGSWRPQRKAMVQRWTAAGWKEFKDDRAGGEEEKDTPRAKRHA